MKRDEDDYVSGRRFAERDESEGGPSYLKLPEGVSVFKFESKKPAVLDIIPYTVGKGNPNADKGEKYIERTYFIHRNVGPNQRSYLCLDRTYNKKCPVCEFVKKLWDTGEEAEIEIAKSLKTSKRQLWNVVDAKNKDDGVQLLDQSAFFFGDQVKLAIDALPEGDEKEKFASPTEGWSLQVQIAKEDFQGRSVYKPKRIDFVARKKQYKPSIIKETYCLDDLLKPLSYDELKRILHQTSEEDDSDSGSKKKGKKAMKRKAVTATSKKIKKGSIVEHDDLGKCKVKSISRDGFTLTLTDEDDDEHKGIGVAEVELAGKSSSKSSKAKSSKASPKKSKKAVEEDDDDEDEEEDDEDEDDDDEDDDSDDDDDEDDDEEDEDEDSDDDDEDDDDEDEEDDEDEDEEDDEPAPKSRRGKKGRK